jgi:hypothetical protein
MAAAKKAPPPSPFAPRLEWDGEKWLARYDEHRYTFLLDDGRVFDVIAVRDDSDLRLAVLEATGATRIEGVARAEADAEAKQEREP